MLLLLIEKGKATHFMFFSLILIVAGIVFLLKNLGYISGTAWSIIWPVILIVIGIGLILKRRNHGFFLARQNFWWPFEYPRDKKQFQKGKIDSK